MLVLSRKVGERIHIGNDVFVEVRRISGNRVTLAVNAPHDIRILRGELVEAAREFDVLDESPVSEAEKETVIMTHIPIEGDLKKEEADSPNQEQSPPVQQMK